MSAMGALGAALSSIGNSRNEQRKEALLERLEKEKDARAQEDQIAQEDRADAREARRVHHTEIRPDANGAPRERGINSFGGEVYNTDANPMELDKIERAKAAEKASLAQTLQYTSASQASEAKTRAETGYLPAKQSLDNRLTESQIAENNAQAARSARPDAKTSDTSLETLTGEMVDEMKDYRGDLSPELFRTAVQEALKAAKIAHKDARTVLLQFLPEYKKKYQGK